MNEAHAAEASRRGFEILGELGHTTARQPVYLAREKQGTALIALRVEYTSPDSFTFSVLRKLDTSVPAAGVTCPYCRAPLPGWGRYCGQCGANIATAKKGMRFSGAAITMLNAIRSATAGEYEVLGEMLWEDGRGAVYFAREMKTGRLTALRLQRQEDSAPEAEDYTLGQTRVLAPLAKSLGAPRNRDAGKPPRISVVSPQPPLSEPSGEPPAPTRDAKKISLFVIAGIAVLIVALLTLVLLR